MAGKERDKRNEIEKDSFPQSTMTLHKPAEATSARKSTLLECLREGPRLLLLAVSPDTF